MAWPLRVALVVIALAWMCEAAAADDLADFNTAVEDVAAHNRTAMGYLRTDTVEMAVAEMELAKNSWGAFAERFGGRRPAAFAGNPHYTETLVDVPTRIVTAFLMLNLSRPDLAWNSLQAIREELSVLRRTSGVEVLADCVLDANKALAAIAARDDDVPNVNDPTVAAGVAAKVDTFAAILKRCDAMASAKVRGDPAFRRLIEGPLAVLATMPKAIEARDIDALRNAIVELRAFDALLTLRYG